MSSVDLDDGGIHYRFDGPAEAPVLVLSNSLGTDLSLWDVQVPAFARQFRVLRYDSRGHGRSLVTPGPYTIDRLGRDVVALLDGLNVERAHFCGLSMGGMIGLWLGVNAPQRIDRLVLCNTSARVGTPDLWNARIEAVRNNGMASIVGAVLERWFTAAFRERSPEAVAAVRRSLEAAPAEGYVAACAAVRDMDQRDAIGRIRLPTLVIAGTHDAVTPPADGRFLADTIPDARYVELDAAHLSNIEAAERFTAQVSSFLTDQEQR